MINGIPRILIIRLSAIGDVVRVLPALHALRLAHPNAQIDWAVERKSADIVDGHPDLDRVVLFERPAAVAEGLREFYRFCKKIQSSRYDIVIDYHGIFKSGLLVHFSQAPERFGFARPRSRELSYLFTNKKEKLPAGLLNRVEENRLLTQRVAPDFSSNEAMIYVPLDVQETVDQYFDETFSSGKRVVSVHAPVERPEKQWPLPHYAELVDMLLADGRFEVLLTWGPGQRACVDAVKRETTRNPVVAPEIPDLKHYAWLVHRTDLYVGGDTGPMHIASAMSTPVVAVFGGTRPGQHAPIRRPYTLLQEEGKDIRSRLEAVTPERVYAACVDMLVR